MPLRASVPPHRAPFSSYTASVNGTYTYFGYLIDLLPLLLQRAGLSTDIDFFPASNNARTGAVESITSGQADLALFPFTATFEPGVDQTVSVYNVGLQLLIKEDSAEQSGVLVFLSPFSPALWIVIACTPFFVAAMLTLIAKLTPLGIYNIIRTRQVGHRDGVHPMEEHAVEAESESFLLEAWMALVGQALIPRGRSWAVRIISLSAGLFGVVILAAYTANLAAILTDTSASTSISSINDVLRRDAMLAVRPSGYTWTYFQTSRDPVVQQLQKNLVPFVEDSRAEELLRGGEVGAVMDLNVFLLAMADTLPCNLKIAGDMIGPTSTVLLLSKNSNLTQPFNKAILELAELGVLDDLEDKWMRAKLCGEQDSLKAADIKPPQLNLISIRGLYYMLFIFAVLSVLWTGVEHAMLAFLSWNEAARKKAEGLSEFLTSDGANLFKEGEAGARAVKHPRGVGYMRRTFSKEGAAMEMADVGKVGAGVHGSSHGSMSEHGGNGASVDTAVVLNSLPGIRYY